MLKHYFKVAFRSISNDKGYSFVNVIGLAVATACCLLLVFWVRFELSFEDCYPYSERIYKVLKIENRTDGKHYSSYFRPPIINELQNAFPEIEAATYISHEMLPFNKESDEKGVDGIMADYTKANIDFLKIFFYEYVEGSPESVQKNRGCIMSEETAKKFFGKNSAIGQTVVFGTGGGVSCTIEAVVKMPENTQVRFDILDPSGRSFGGIQYIMLKENVKLSSEKITQIEDFLSTMNETEDKLALQPIKDIHLNSHESLSVNTSWETYGDKKQIYLFSLAAFLILVIAVINYVNTSIARAMSRMKEVGLRKVSGSTRNQLIIRFLSETFIISFVAVFVALFFVKFLFPDFSEIMGNEVPLLLDAGTVLITFVFCIIVSLLSGGYAAFYLSSFNPIRALKGGSQTGSRETFRKALVGFQFFLSISILICTILMYRQINGLFNADTGVDKNNIIVLESNLWYGADEFIQIIKKENPNVIDATIASSPPYNSTWGYSGVSWAGSSEDVKSMEFTQIFCDYHYANTFGLEVIAGEFIPPGLTWWQYSEDKSYNIVINEAFQKVMGEENPLGITVSYGWGQKGKIIGVVKDFNFKPLREKITPLIISFNPESSSTVYVKTTGRDKKATLDYVLQKYKEMKPDHASTPVMYHTVEDDFNKMYEVELRTAKILAIFSVISLLLSLMGIISMVSFMIEKRTKEIAIRKINGAGLFDIIRLFLKEFSQLALISSIVAIPLCYYIMNLWLESYLYRISLSWWIFLGIPALILLIIACVISIQIYLTTRHNPAEALKTE
ncbi:MAG: ABC transporter permease [Prevotella sp.]|jgi:putative ABC transport system permease protein|nr:ABC transporter permease [Prevotella sp.]